MEDARASAEGEVAELWRRLGSRFEGRRRRDGAELDGTTTLVDRTARVFRLRPIERDVIVFLLGVALGRGGPQRSRDVRIADLIDALGAGGERAELVAALDEAGALAAYALVSVRGDGAVMNRTIALADAFWPRLLGAPARVLGVHMLAPEVALDALVRSPEVTARVEAAGRWLGTARDAWPTVIVHGPTGSGRGAVAGALAGVLGAELVVLDGAQLRAATLPAWRREITWHDAVPVIADADRAEPTALAALAQLACPLFATASSAITERVIAPSRAIRLVQIDAAEACERGRMWSRELARAGAAEHALDVAALAARFQFAPGRIATAAQAIVASGATTDPAAAIELCRTIPEVRVGGLARRIDTPYGWDDLVVTPAVRAELELITTWGRRGARLFARDGVGARARPSRGLACLFHGPPGTGKTLAAHVVASQLGIDLYRVDLAQVVDKYIGETEKRLDLLFREAEAAGVILFFDEADALFTRRTEVNEARDRYANLETGFLLQRLEDHRGLTILASNLQCNLDAAFQRRLGVILELSPPGPVERQRIWDKLLPLPEQRDPDIDVELIARRITLAGGDIRNAVFAALLLAEQGGERLAMRHLALAIWREMKKAGRLFDPTELGPWQAVIAERIGAARR